MVVRVGKVVKVVRKPRAQVQRQDRGQAPLSAGLSKQVAVRARAQKLNRMPALVPEMGPAASVGGRLCWNLMIQLHQMKMERGYPRSGEWNR